MTTVDHQDIRQIVDRLADPDRTVVNLLLHEHPRDAVAYVVVGADGESIRHTYADLDARSARIASVLAGHGIGPGSRVATLVGKCLDLPATILAAWRLGAVYLPLFTAFETEAVRDRLERSGAGVIVTESAQAGKIPDGAWTVLQVDDPDFQADVDAAEPVADRGGVGPDVPLVHLFTSGTTGKPKAVVHTRHHLTGWTGYMRYALGLEPDAVFWSAADPGWAYGLYTVIVGPLLVGVPSIVVADTFKAEATWELLERLEVTDFAAAPTALRALKNSDGARELPALRRISSAGEPLSPDVFDWTRDRGHPVHDHYGQTELGMCAGFPQAVDGAPDPVPGATGVALPGWRMAVLETDSTDEAPRGRMGRLAIEGAASPFMSFVGYGSDREDPKDKFTDDGRWYLTGDLATCDGDGIFRFMSRDDDVILMAGYRIGPFDIESTLAKHPAVAASAVVAAPDVERGEIAHAFVVLAEGRTGDDALTAELQEFVKSTYARHAYPRAITYLDELPATPSGKIRRNVLREQVR